MDKDRTAICTIISDMFEDVDENGIYPTTRAFGRLKTYIEGVRAEAIGWTHADMCVALDKGEDPRLKECPEMLERAQKDLSN